MLIVCRVRNACASRDEFCYLRLPVTQLAGELKEYIPVGSPLFGGDVMSDRPLRFFAAEIIREQIFACYSQEVRGNTPNGRQERKRV